MPISKEDESAYARIIAKNLKRLLYMSGKTQADVVRDLKIKQSSVSSWMTAKRIPKIDTIDMFCDYLNCTRSDIMEEYTGQPRTVEAVRIPVLGHIAAGIPLEMIEDIIDYEEIPAAMARGGGKFFGLVIQGHSMEPKISDGDVVIIKQQPDVENGEIAIVAVNGTDATCKKVRKHHDGIELVPLNPSYETMFFSNEEVETLPVTILGRVVELRAKM